MLKKATQQSRETLAYITKESLISPSTDKYTKGRGRIKLIAFDSLSFTRNKACFNLKKRVVR